jgi:hypothetical protein
MGLNNISVLSWQSVLLVEETGVPGDNQVVHTKSDIYLYPLIAKAHDFIVISIMAIP